jgi:hypothetical protein
MAKAAEIGGLTGDFGANYLPPGILAPGRRHRDLRVLSRAHSCVVTPPIHPCHGNVLPVAHESDDIEACQLLKYAGAQRSPKADQYKCDVG